MANFNIERDISSATMSLRLFIRIDEEVEPMIIGGELIRSTMERLVRLIFGQGTIIVQLLIDRSKIHSTILHVGRIKIRTSSVNLIISSSHYANYIN